MARKRFTTEQIIGLLREAEVRLSRGQAIGTVCRSIGVSQQSYYRWRCEYGSEDQSRVQEDRGGHVGQNEKDLHVSN